MKVKSIRALSLFTVLSATIAVANAQKQWTLDECITYAIDHNVNIQQRAIQIQKSKVSLETSNNAWLPEVNAHLGEQFSFGNYNSTTGSMQSDNSDNNYDECILKCLRKIRIAEHI